jgi:hypothetical protein
MAAISFFDGEIAGFATSPRVGYLVLGRLEGNNPSNQHVLYPASALIPKQNFTCALGDDGMASSDEVISYWDATRVAKGASIDAAKVAGANVKIYVEADYEPVPEQGSAAACRATSRASSTSRPPSTRPSRSRSSCRSSSCGPRRAPTRATAPRRC